jgi:hypothetical protein
VVSPIEVGEWQRAAASCGAPGEVLTTTVESRSQALRDGLQVGDLSRYLAEFGRRPALPARVGTPPVPMCAEVNQLGDLIEGESQSLGRLDNAEHGQRLLGIQSVATRAALRLR